MASTNLVYRISDRTSHHNLKAQIEPLPTVQDHEVLVEIRGVTLNARDLQICSGLYPAAAVKDDLVPCSDGAGVIAAVGPAVDDIHVGDRVIINIALDNLYGPLKSQDHMLGGGVDGTLRQYAAVPALAITKVPEECKLDYVQLASLVCTGATVWNSLYGYVPMKPGQAVLFQGTGGVSITGVQLAKAAGAVTIVTSSSDEKLKFVKEKFGVDHAINYRTTPNWAEEVRRFTNGEGADYVIEIGGAGTIEQSIKATASGGMIAVIGYLADIEQENMPNVPLLALIQGCVLRGVQAGSKQLSTELMRFVSRQNVQPYIHKTFGFSQDDVVAAFDLLNSGSHIGKIGIAVKEQ
uniref:Enoyl reductase (ER) domain-containing protein n=1 Tax=Phytophthora ramorum TaxID=164328 RepID=H3GSZ2_PHYRM